MHWSHMNVLIDSPLQTFTIPKHTAQFVELFQSFNYESTFYWFGLCHLIYSFRCLTCTAPKVSKSNVKMSLKTYAYLSYLSKSRCSRKIPLTYFFWYIIMRELIRVKFFS